MPIFRCGSPTTSGTWKARIIDRNLNRVVAVALLDDFLADRSLWRDCGFLNRWNARTDHTIADHIDSWTDFLHGKGFVPRTPQLVKTLLFGAGKGARVLASGG